MIRVSEKGVLCGGAAVEYSSTVVLIAVVISSREVYGKQMLKMQLYPSVSYSSQWFLKQQGR